MSARIAQQAHAAHDILLAAPLDEVAARIGVRAGDGVRDVLQRDIVGFQAGRIDLHLILLDGSAETVDIGHAGNAFELALQRPVFQRLAVPSGASPRDRIAEDLAGRAGEGRQRGLHARRNIGGGDALHHLLAGEIVVHAVLEDQIDDRQAEQRAAAQAG